MPLDFPASPNTGDIYPSSGSTRWQWNGTAWTALAGAGPTYAPINSPVLTGDPQAPTATYGDSDASLATTAFVQSAVAPQRNNTGRNLVHNAQFNVQQRGNPGWTVGGSYTADRWMMNFGTGDANTVGIATLTDTARSDIGDESAVNGLSCNFTGSANVAGFVNVLQRIENVRRLAGKTATLSFWANTSVAGLKLGVNATQVFGTGGSPSAAVQILATGLSVTLGTTWARYSVSLPFPSVAGKTFGTNGDHLIALQLWYSSGANFNTVAGNIGVQSGVINLWGVQLEIGSVATPLEKLEAADDLRHCQRFAYNALGSVFASGYHPTASGLSVFATRFFPAQMRAAPTVSGQSFTGSINNTAPAAFHVANDHVVWSAANLAAGSFQLNVAGEFYSADL
jgi:hypothetical protein